MMIQGLPLYIWDLGPKSTAGFIYGETMVPMLFVKKEEEKYLQWRVNQ